MKATYEMLEAFARRVGLDKKHFTLTGEFGTPDGVVRDILFWRKKPKETSGSEQSHAITRIALQRVSERLSEPDEWYSEEELIGPIRAIPGSPIEQLRFTHFSGKKEDEDDFLDELAVEFVMHHYDECDPDKVSPHIMRMIEEKWITL